MPRDLSDETFDALKKAVEHIDFRAKRLQEWRSLGQSTDTFKARFDVFMTRLSSAQDPPTNTEIAGLQSAWADCASDLIQLSLVTGEFQSITAALTHDGSPDPTVAGWIDKTVAVGTRVGDALSQKSFVALGQQVVLYKEEYTRLRVQRDAKINSEILHLVALANGLRSKFE